MNGKQSLSYTSGTTGKPKGVVYHHRGSYLMSTGSVTAWNMPNKLTYLNVCQCFIVMAGVTLGLLAMLQWKRLFV